MLDIHFIRDNLKLVKTVSQNKGVAVDFERLLELDEKRRQLRQEIDEINRQRNELSERDRGSKPTESVIAQGKELKVQIASHEDKLRAIETEYEKLLHQVPNIPTDDTPIGKDETENKVLRIVGEKPNFTFKPLEHWEIGKALDIIDTQTAAEVSGARFAYLKNAAVLLQIALINYAFSTLTDREKIADIIKNANLDVPDKPFVPIVPPIMVKTDVYQKMARLEPRSERYGLPEDDLWLIGSAEHTMGPLHINQTLSLPQVPLRYVGISVAMRREAGSYGKDTKGIFRLHQFDKIEMESFSDPAGGLSEHNLMVAIQEYFMRSLGIPYQVVLKCTGDMGSPNARAVDIECWMPGQNRYRETHTADYMTDYQSRRLNTKVKTAGNKTSYVHMNDATVFAIGRTLIAIIENYQTVEGTVTIPEVLQPYTFGLKEIV